MVDDVRAHPLEGQGLPGREHLDPVAPPHRSMDPPAAVGEGLEIVGQLVGGRPRWG